VLSWNEIEKSNHREGVAQTNRHLWKHSPCLWSIYKSKKLSFAY
jgi:hypothetical protein